MDRIDVPVARPRPARIKDVAALAGVSLKTVTNVVHERPYVGTRPAPGSRRRSTSSNTNPRWWAGNCRAVAAT